MTTIDLAAELRIAIEDINSVKFPSDSSMYTFLNTAQLKAAGLLHNNYLTEFEVSPTAIPMPAAGVALDGLEDNVEVLKAVNGIISVRCHFMVAGNYLFAKFLPIQNLHLTDNSDFGGTDDEPRWYVKAGRLHVKIDGASYIGSAGLQVEVTFLRVPETLDSSTDPLLNDAYRSIMIDLAAEAAFNSRDEVSRAKLSRESAFAVIKSLNDKIDF